ncbi:MAG: hypothetical protein EBS01_16505, partial [Verrucomicrobia bacterium]|nr:hypothetical protein [Verrucomicrobiota bacterium]
MSQTHGPTVNFSNSAMGLAGSNARLAITNAPALTNNILPWAVVGGSEFASFVSLGTQGDVTAGGVGALSQVGYAGYDQTLTGTLAGVVSLPTSNLKLAGVGTIAAAPFSGGTLFLNSLNIASTSAGTLSFGSASDVLSLNSGGFLRSGAFNFTLGNTVNSGTVTAASGALYLFNSANSLTVNSRVRNAQDGTPVKLVISGLAGSSVTLASGSNDYTGGTVVNGATLNLSGGNLPAGGVTLNGGSFFQVSGVIDPGNIFVLNGNSTATLSGTNTLSGLVFYNNGGSLATTLNAGTLTLTGGITALSANANNTAVIAGSLDFNGASQTITV